MSESDGSAGSLWPTERLGFAFFAAPDADFFFADVFFAPVFLTAGVFADFARFLAGAGVVSAEVVLPLAAPDSSSAAGSFF